MTVVETMRWVVLGIVFLYGVSMSGAGFGLRSYRRTLFWLSVLGVIWIVAGEPVWRGWQQYLAWGGNNQTSGLLSENPRYIYSYVWGRFLAWRVIGGTVSGIIYWLAIRFIVKPSDGFKLNRNEALLIAFGIALAGWPLFVIYFAGLVLAYIAILVWFTGREGRARRFPVAFPATLALITIPLGQQLLVWLSNAFEINFLIYNVTNLSI